MGLLSDNARASDQNNTLANLLRGITGGVNSASNKLSGLLDSIGSFDSSMADSAQQNIGNRLAGLLGNPKSPAIFNTPQQQQIMSMAGSLMPMGIIHGGDMASSLNPKYGDTIDAYLTEPKSGPAVLSKVVVNPDARGQGIGTRFMNDLTGMADEQGKTLALSPSADFGGNKVRLIEFYKRFGFVPNKGRNMDYSISESMRREPQQ